MDRKQASVKIDQMSSKENQCMLVRDGAHVSGIRRSRVRWSLTWGRPDASADVNNRPDGYRIKYDQHADGEVKMRQDSDSALAESIAVFKSDPEKFRQVTEFVDLLIQQAKKEAELKYKENEKSKLENQDVDIGLKRRLGRARGFVLRMFDALCNCTQTAAAAARTTARNNPFSRR